MPRPRCGRATAAPDAPEVRVGAVEFAALMAALGPFAHDRRVVAAVSGGPDSMALALLLARWGQPLACIVDHGLRPESAMEAAQAAQRLARLGIPARILRAQLVPGPAAAGGPRRPLCAPARRLPRGGLRRPGARSPRRRPGRDRPHAPGCGQRRRRARRNGRNQLPQRGQAAAAAARRGAGAAARHAARGRRRVGGGPHQPGPAHAAGPAARRNGGASTAAARRIASCCGAERRALERQIAAELGEVRFHPEGYAVVSKELSGAALSALLWTISGRAYPPPRAALNPRLGRARCIAC